MPWLLLAALATSAVAGSLPAPRGALRDELPLYRPWRDAPKVFVEAGLPDGSAGLFLVDTGADTSILSRRAAERLALPVQEDGLVVAGLTAVATVDQATLPWVRLGGVVVPDVVVAVDVPGHADAWGFLPVDGILGNNVWSRFVVELDYRADRLVLRRPGAVRLPRRASPLAFDGGHAQVPVQFTTRAHPDRHHAVVLALDTGATGMILRGAAPADLDGAFTEGLEPLVGIGIAASPPSSHLRATRRVPLDQVVLGGRRVRAPVEARWIEYDGRRVNDALTVRGLVGHDLLEGRRLVLDYQGGRVLLGRSARPPAFHDAHARALERLLDAHGDAPEAWLPRARLHLGMDDVARAEALLRRLVTAGDPAQAARAEARVLLARLLRHGGDADGALRALTPVPAEILVDHGELGALVNGLSLEGRRAQAWRVVSRALARRQGHPEVLVAQADLLLADGRPEAAQLALLRASHLAGDPDAHLLRRARAALDQGDRDGALALLRAGVRRDPLDGRALWFYARLAGPADHAVLRRDLAFVEGRTHPAQRPADFLAAAHLALGDVERAAALAAEGASRHCRGREDRADLDNCRAWYLAVAGQRLDEAQRRVDRALRRGERAHVLDTLAVIHSARGEPSAAQDAARRAVRLAPDDPYALWQAAWSEGAPAR